jgi:putative transposase
MSYGKTSHAVYDLKSHLVWMTKDRKPVLRGQIGLRLRDLLRQTCETLEGNLAKGQVAVEQVQRLVSVPPRVSVRALGQSLKGRSSRRRLEEFGEWKRQIWGQPLWACGSFAASLGKVTDESRAQSIENQGKELPDEDQDFRVGEL